MVWIYIKELVKHALNVYSLISFSLVFVMPFLPISNSTQSILAAIFAAIAILLASYFTWKDLYEKKEEGKFFIIPEYHTLCCGSVNGAGMIKETSRAFFDIDFVNGTQETQVIQKISKFSIENGNNLFGYEKVKISFREANNPHQDVILPIKVKANDRRILQIIIELPVVESNPVNLPKILSELSNIEMSIVFRVSNQSAEVKEHKVVLSAPVESYTREIAGIWKEHGCPELYETYQRLIA